MPVTWTISHPEKLVVAICEGEVEHADVDRYMQALIADGAMPYRKLFDATFAPFSMGLAQLRALGTRVVEHAKGGKIGPLALVVGSELALEMAQIFEAQAQAAGRPMRIFDNVVAARAWLDSLASPKD